MDALMIYHNAICKDSSRRRSTSISSHSGRALAAFENSLKRMPKVLLAPFGVGKWGPANRPRTGER